MDNPEIQKLVNLQESLKKLTMNSIIDTYNMLINDGYHQTIHQVKFITQEIVYASQAFPQNNEAYCALLVELYNNKNENNFLHLIPTFLRPLTNNHINYRLLRRCIHAGTFTIDSLLPLFPLDNGLFTFMCFADLVKEKCNSRYNDIKAGIKKGESAIFKEIKDSDEYEKNNFDKLTKFIESGWIPETIQYHIQQDDLEYLQNYINEKRSEGNFDISAKLDCSSLLSRVIDPILTDASLIEYACFYGSVKCFKFLVESDVPLTESLVPFACSGGNLEIVHIISRKNIKMFKGANQAIMYRHTDLFKWLLEFSRSTTTERNTAMQYACRYHNVDAMLELMQGPIDMNQSTNALSILQLDNLALLQLAKSRGCNFRHIACACQAARSGNSDILSYLVKNHTIIYDPKELDFLPLIDATYGANPECFRILLDAGLNPNVANREQTLMQAACAMPSLEIIKLLTSHGAYINDIVQKVTNPDKPITIAARNGYLDIVKHLVEHGAEYDTETQINTTTRLLSPLSAAAQSGHLDVVKYLVEINCNPTENGSLPMILASQNNHPDVVEYLLQQAKYKEKALMHTFTFAVKNMDLDTMDRLINIGASLELKDNEGLTILHHAATTNVTVMQKLLNCKGCNPTIKDSKGNPPILTALDCDNYPILSLLSKIKGVLNDSNSIGKTPLHIAVDNLNFDAVDLFLNNGANPNAKDNKGLTPLLCLVTQSPSAERETMISILLNAGGDCNIVDSLGRNSFHRIVMNSPSLSEIDLFLSHLKELNTSDKNGKPMILDATKSSLPVFDYIVSFGGNINLTDQEGNTCLHAACSHDNIDVVKRLVKSGIGLNTKNELGRNCLFSAVCSMKINVVKYLLESGMNINDVDDKGNTPALALMLAKGKDAKPIYYKFLVSAQANLKKKNKDNQSVKKLATLFNLDEIVNLCSEK
ncbi:hypothetical protein TVAG_401410 [Trichomonas vaginalis G3]|uniref:Uncharacterized protein n=1 Tax=Trichomonas vaginalis (strain ATCC PRA-98 / G3) TaxID=412133 RepID=A2EGA8_TRIV3|nr:spectrin binding [Trichomonas vaginalis G3]EAY08287.1 hypothetical protein TVAG_401410 [Trichomonas vaginalis G3]KAI5546119.1 spectrin binding [Trichomonas vaginalis G3]|eukprot:XP_001320510.1 hypothetical protein [Trichomonas vaginalis G3]